MPRKTWFLGLACLAASGLFAPVAHADFPVQKLALLPEDDSVYAPPRPMREDEGVNQGGAHVELNVNYMTAHFYRGINYNQVNNKKDAPNLQFDAKLEFDLGKLPHPFIGVFANVYDSDPISRFQEIRPVLGVEWKVRPFIAAIGHNSYIYPEREKFDTSEVWARVTFDDSIIFRTDQPILSPYVYGAYDYDFNKGWYLEAGVRHDFVVEDTGLVVSALADIGYIAGIKQQFVFVNRQDTGVQHYDVGLIANYSLNRFFKFSRRYGEWSLNGFVFYTNGINRDIIHSDTQVWGGMGIGFKY